MSGSMSVGVFSSYGAIPQVGGSKSTVPCVNLESEQSKNVVAPERR